MKKIVTLIAAVLLSALISVSAGARTKTIADYQLVYDTCYDWYWIMDPATGATAGIRYSDGAIEWYSGYPEDDGTNSYEDYKSTSWWYEQPYAEVESISVDYVEMHCEISSDWEADYYEVKRKTSDSSSWTTLESYEVYNGNSSFHVWYTDYELPDAKTLTYRFSFYKYFDEGTFEVTYKEITVDDPGNPEIEIHDDFDPPTLTATHAAANDVELYCTVPLEWGISEYSVERRTDSTDWKELYYGDVWTYGGDFEVWYHDTNTPSSGKVYYRFRFYRYDLNGLSWDPILATSAEISVNLSSNYPAPQLTKAEASDTVANFTLSADNRWNAAKCVVNRRTSTAGTWQKVGEMTKQSGSSSTLFTYSDSGLTKKTKYYYQFALYSASGELLTTVETSVTTTATPEKPKMLTPIAHSDSITLTAEVDSLWNADGFEVYRYSSKKKKWEKLTESESFGYSDRKDGTFRTATYTNTGLKSSCTYKYQIKLYREVNGKREYFSTLSKSVKTLMPAPKLTVAATAKKATLSWSKVTGATGYEVYVLALNKGDSYGWTDSYDPNAQRTTLPKYDAALSKYNQSYYTDSAWSTKEIKEFTKKATLKGKTSTSFTIKSGKVYLYIVRAYKQSGSTKIYSDFSSMEATDTTSALLNGVKLKSKVTVSDYDLKLIKAALKKCTNSKMTKAEKAAAIYVYVHNAATYEYDYTKIPADPIEAILSAGRGQCYQYAATYQAMMKYIGYDVKLVSGKTSSGSPHWWCQLTIAGTDYMIDPQVGGRFLITYESMWDYAVTPEKVYD